MIGVVLGILGATACFVGIGLARRARASRDWPQAPGRIMSVDVREVWLGRGALYFPALRYEYRVGQAQLMGSRVGYATRFPAFSHATAMYVLRRDYPKGSAVTVRYDPTNPHEAILEPGLRVALQSLVLVGSLFIIVAIIAVTFGRSTT